MTTEYYHTEPEPEPKPFPIRLVKFRDFWINPEEVQYIQWKPEHVLTPEPYGRTQPEQAIVVLNHRQELRFINTTEAECDGLARKLMGEV